MHQGIDKRLGDSVAHTGLSKHGVLRVPSAFVALGAVYDEVQHEKIFLNLFDMLLRDLDRCLTLLFYLNDRL